MENIGRLQEKSNRKRSKIKIETSEEEEEK